MRKAFGYLVTVVSFIAAYAGVSYWRRTNAVEQEAATYFHSKAAQEAFVAATKPIYALPEYKSAVRSLSTPTEAMQWGAKTTAAGLTRLSNDMLVERSVLMEKILRMATPRECAALLRGVSPSPDTGSPYYALLEKLPTEELKEWLYISMTSMKAQLENSPPKHDLQEAAIKRAFVTMAVQLDSLDREKITTLLTSAATQDDISLCDEGITLYRSINSASTAIKGDLARAVVQQ